MASTHWILQRVTKSPGRNNTTCWRFRWVGVEEREILETTTDSTSNGFFPKN